MRYAVTAHAMTLEPSSVVGISHLPIYVISTTPAATEHAAAQNNAVSMEYVKVQDVIIATQLVILHMSASMAQGTLFVHPTSALLM